MPALTLMRVSFRHTLLELTKHQRLCVDNKDTHHFRRPGGDYYLPYINQSLHACRYNYEGDILKGKKKGRKDNLSRQ